MKLIWKDKEAYLRPCSEEKTKLVLKPRSANPKCMLITPTSDTITGRKNTDTSALPTMHFKSFPD